MESILTARRSPPAAVLAALLAVAPLPALAAPAAGEASFAVPRAEVEEIAQRSLSRFCERDRCDMRSFAPAMLTYQSRAGRNPPMVLVRYHDKENPDRVVVVIIGEDGRPEVSSSGY